MNCWVKGLVRTYLKTAVKISLQKSSWVYLKLDNRGEHKKHDDSKEFYC